MTEVAPGPRPVLDRVGLPNALPEFVSDGSRDDVGRTTRRERDDPPDGFRWPPQGPSLPVGAERAKRGEGRQEQSLRDHRGPPLSPRAPAVPRLGMERRDDLGVLESTSPTAGRAALAGPLPLRRGIAGRTEPQCARPARRLRGAR